jgi:hypothetical protein
VVAAAAPAALAAAAARWQQRWRQWRRQQQQQQQQRCSVVLLALLHEGSRLAELAMPIQVSHLSALHAGPSLSKVPVGQLHSKHSPVQRGPSCHANVLACTHTSGRQVVHGRHPVTKLLGNWRTMCGRSTLPDSVLSSASPTAQYPCSTHNGPQHCQAGSGCLSAAVHSLSQQRPANSLLSHRIGRRCMPRARPWLLRRSCTCTQRLATQAARQMPHRSCMCRQSMLRQPTWRAVQVLHGQAGHLRREVAGS